MKKILITGGLGFVGSALTRELIGKGYDVRITTRSVPKNNFESVEMVQVENINEETDWFDALVGVDVVIHCAARVHVMKNESADSFDLFMRCNCFGTLNLATQAAEVGVKRFIFLSTIGVNGAFTPVGQKFTELDVPNPNNAYSLSKYEAEIGLKSISEKTALEVVIIRPPMVYGRGAPGNFKFLQKVVQSGFPLPFGNVNNSRSFVSIDNLVDFIALCVSSSKAANELFLVSDGYCFSTSSFINQMASHTGSRVKQFNISVRMLRYIFNLLGMNSYSQRLLNNLEIDVNKSYRLLDWIPPFSMEYSMKKAMKK